MHLIITIYVGQNNYFIFLLLYIFAVSLIILSLKLIKIYLKWVYLKTQFDNLSIVWQH